MHSRSRMVSTPQPYWGLRNETSRGLSKQSLLWPFCKHGCQNPSTDPFIRDFIRGPPFSQKMHQPIAIANDASVLR